MSLSHEFEIADVPQHQAEMTSSIGGFGKPERASFERLKGIHEWVVENQLAMEGFFSEFNTAKKELNGEYTRVQHRGLISIDFLREQVAAGHEWIKYLEVIVPVDEQYALVYLSHNTAERLPDSRDEELMHNNLEGMNQAEFKSYSSTIQDAEKKGYSIEILTEQERFGDQQQHTVDQLYELYQRFGWNRNDIVSLCTNRNNIISVAKKNGKIVSAGIAEMAKLSFKYHDTGDMKQVNIVEITEAATADGYTNKGLYAAVSCRLLQSLTNTDVDLVFGECNTLSAGVLRVAKAQGRMDALTEMKRWRFFDRGFLIQQVPINDPTGTRYSRYNNLLVMWLTRNALLDYAKT